MRNDRVIVPCISLHLLIHRAINCLQNEKDWWSYLKARNSVATTVTSCFSWLRVCLYTVRGRYFWCMRTHSFFCRLRLLLKSKGSPKNSCARNIMRKIRVWGADLVRAGQHLAVWAVYKTRGHLLPFHLCVGTLWLLPGNKGARGLVPGVLPPNVHFSPLEL